MNDYYRVSYDGDDELLRHEGRYSFLSAVSLCCKKSFSLKTLKRRIPIVSWLPCYRLSDFKGDAVAGLTVALTVIPQGLALAQLAHLPPQYGLYTAFMGCFMYTIFGSCKDLTIGPTAIMSIMTAEYAGIGGIKYVILMTFLSGCIQLVMGILHLGFLINFISASVITGFTSAAAITIATSQLMGLFGVKGNSNEFIETVYQLFSRIGEANYWDAIMGIICLLLLLLLKYFKDLKFREDSAINLKARKVLKTVWWIISTGKNALLVLVCGGLAAILLGYNLSPFTLTEEIKPGLPPFEPPVFSVNILVNSTNKTEHKDFIKIVEDLGAGIIIIPLLSILEAIAIAKAFAKGKKLDATQEMVALGICNIMGSFVSAYPATGSFSRTAINHSSGVRTPFGGVFTGATVILALCVLSPYFRYIPKPALSAIIIVAVINMVHYKDVFIMWRTNKWDLLPFAATFICSFVLGLEYGIIIGVALSIVILLIHESRPRIITKQKITFHGHEYLYVKPDRTVLFPSAELLVNKITKNIPDNMNDLGCYTVVIDGENIVAADYTTAMGIRNLINTLNKENILIVFINTNMDIIRVINGARPSPYKFCTLEEQIEPIIQDHMKETGFSDFLPPLAKVEDLEQSLVNPTNDSSESVSKHDGNVKSEENGQLQ